MDMQSIEMGIMGHSTGKGPENRWCVPFQNITIVGIWLNKDSFMTKECPVVQRLSRIREFTKSYQFLMGAPLLRLMEKGKLPDHMDANEEAQAKFKPKPPNAQSEEHQLVPLECGYILDLAKAHSNLTFEAMDVMDVGVAMICLHSVGNFKLADMKEVTTWPFWYTIQRYYLADNPRFDTDKNGVYSHDGYLVRNLTNEVMMRIVMALLPQEVYEDFVEREPLVRAAILNARKFYIWTSKDVKGFEKSEKRLELVDTVRLRRWNDEKLQSKVGYDVVASVPWLPAMVAESPFLREAFKDFLKVEKKENPESSKRLCPAKYYGAYVEKNKHSQSMLGKVKEVLKIRGVRKLHGYFGEEVAGFEPPDEMKMLDFFLQNQAQIKAERIQSKGDHYKGKSDRHQSKGDHFQSRKGSFKGSFGKSV